MKLASYLSLYFSCWLVGRQKHASVVGVVVACYIFIAVIRFSFLNVY